MTSGTQQLEDVIPKHLFNHPHCYDPRKYARWEKEVASIVLIEQGFNVLRWYSIEQDSFGPLIRGVEVKRNNIMQTFWYGY